MQRYLCTPLKHLHDKRDMWIFLGLIGPWLITLLLADESADLEGKTSYGSVVQLQLLVDTECSVADMLNLMAFNPQYSPLKAFDAVLKSYWYLCVHAKEDDYSMMKRPLGVILYLKRLYSIWSQTEQFIQKCCSDLVDEVAEIRRDNDIWAPSEQDVKANVISMLHLQNVYNMTAVEMVKLSNLGEEANCCKLSSMTKTFFDNHAKLTTDITEIAEVALQEDDMILAVDWLKLAFQRKLSESANPSEGLESLFKQLSALFSSEQNNDMARGKADLRAAVFLNRTDSIETRMTSLVVRVVEEWRKHGQVSKPKILPRPGVNLETLHHFHKLCREETPHKNSKLVCYYKQNTAFLRLARLKAEQLHVRPTVLIFRNALSPKENDELKRLATPLLSHGKVLLDYGGVGGETDESISHIGWLSEKNSTLVQTINRRMRDITDLSLQSANMLHVSNYKFGGDHIPHYDYEAPEDIGSGEYENLREGDKPGNVVATVLMFLSTTDAGGATVFPNLNLTIHTSQGDAIAWNNLLHHGRPDESTLHAGCPVLAGSKWIANKWFSEHGQEFVRPCAIDEDFYE